MAQFPGTPAVHHYSEYIGPETSPRKAPPTKRRYCLKGALTESCAAHCSGIPSATGWTLRNSSRSIGHRSQAKLATHRPRWFQRRWSQLSAIPIRAASAPRTSSVESHHADADSPLHPADERLLKEVWETLGRARAVLRLLQLLPDSQFNPRDTRHAGITDHVWDLAELLA